ncbi:MAG: dTDP-4-dehydrorhamnose reductase [Coriobacteriia bacterium]|nr:dTDP-4-dehydrorhamnose reductase [Coriobacteriia bacterium]
MPDRVLIAGAGGMLGTALQRVLAERGSEVVAPAEADFDITDDERVRAVVGAFADDGGGVLVNAAAYTNVEAAEDAPDVAFLVNETGARILAQAARDAGLAFVHVSTDFVFDGTKDGAYTEDDEPNPLSVYGTSKLAGERAVLEAHPEALTVRTAWVFGPAGENFPVKILRAARERDALQVVDDERGSPTYTMDLATGILGLIDHGAKGLYHLAGSGSCTRFEFAAEILKLAGANIPMEPVPHGHFSSKVARPRNSVLDCSKAARVGVTMPPWQDALQRFMCADTDVIIVAHNAGGFLEAAVTSAREQVGAGRILVMDAESTDGSVNAICTRFSDVQVLAVPNAGFAASNNRGISLTSGRFVLLLNPDAELCNGAVRVLVDYAEEHPEVGIVGASILNPDGSLQANAFGRFPSLLEYLRLRIWRLTQRLKGNRSLSPMAFDVPTSVDWTTGAAMLVRREAIEDVGFMDEGYFLYYEDVDWCWRMREKGWGVVVVPQARVIHHLGQSGVRGGAVARAYRESLEKYTRDRGLTGLRLASGALAGLRRLRGMYR